MKWLLLTIAIGGLLVGTKMILGALQPDPNVLPGWNSPERRRMMLRAEIDQEEELGFV